MKEEIMVKQIFKVGDVVKCVFYGDREFELIGCSDDKYPLAIDSDDIYGIFTIDGKDNTDHTHPVLTLIRRPSDMVKQEFRVGDIVKCTFSGDREFELQENFASENSLKFLGMFNSSYFLTKDGKIDTMQTNPILTLIRRPSDMVKKEIVLVGFITKNALFVEYEKDSENCKCSLSKPDHYTKVSERTIEVVG